MQTGRLHIVLNVFNLVLLLSALALFGLSIAVEKAQVNISLAEYTTPIFVVACCISVFVLLGCVAICTDSTFLLRVYAVGLVVLGVVVFLVACVLFAVQPLIRRKVEDRLKHYYDMSVVDPKALATVTAVQKAYKCCGFNGPNDKSLFPRGIITRPILDSLNTQYILGSCCPETSLMCSKKDAYQVNCKTAVADFIKYLVIGIAAVLLVLGIASIGMGLLTYFYIKKHNAP